MFLAVDIGNTNTEFGVFDGEALKSFRINTIQTMTSDEIGLSISQYLQFQNINSSDIESVYVTSVVPQMNHSMRNAIIKYVGKVPKFYGDDFICNMVNKYSDPKAVGADRMITAYGALRKYGAPLIVVDFGTATTFDVVDKEGAYLGGAIYPGLKISLDALVQRTAKLPRIEIVKPKHVIGQSTIESMQSGLIYGYVGSVKNLVETISADLGYTPKIVATGGLAKSIGEVYKDFYVIDSTLILDGLKMLHDEYEK